MLKTALALMLVIPTVAIPLTQDSPLKPKQSPADGVTVASEFRGIAGRPLFLSAKSTSPVRWVALTPGLEFAAAQDVDAHLKDSNVTVCCGKAGEYKVMVLASGVASDNRPHEPGYCTVTFVEARGK